MNCSDSQIPRNKLLFNQNGRHVNATVLKSLEIQAWSITKPRTQSGGLGENLHEY